MAQETELFFGHMLRTNRSLLDFLDAEQIAVRVTKRMCKPNPAGSAK